MHEPMVATSNPVALDAWIDPSLKAEAEGILAELGMSPSDVIRVFYKQITLRRGLPFDVLLPNEETQRVLQESAAGEGHTEYPDVDAMFKAMGT